MTIYEELSDHLMQFYTDGEFKKEAIKAKNEFYDMAGIFDESSSGFEMRLAQFMDWYLFTRPHSEIGLTPIQIQVERGLMKTPEENTIFYQNLAASRHSLFEFLKITNEDLKIKDLFSGYTLVVKNSPVVHGFDKEELFEGRLIPHKDSFVFSSGFCFHPKEASKFILQEIKKVKKLPEKDEVQARNKLIIRLFKMRQKYDQYKHVAISGIYSNESKVGV